MPDLLLELFCEEIPARMQRRAADDLRKRVTDALVEAGLPYEGARAFVTPRRLALTVHGLPARSPDSREEKKGPRVGAPDKAIEGFLRASGLASIDQATIQSDKKGDFYVAIVEKPGRPAADVIAVAIPEIIRSFPWQKSMRWGEQIGEEVLDSKGEPILDSKGAAIRDHSWLRWVRPLHSILCTFGPETEEPEVVAFEVGGIRAGNTTSGHRFMAPEPITVRRFDDYAEKLEAAKVVLDAERRKDIILHDARDRALALGLELVEDEALADEVSGLVEWPVVLVGAFDPAFLELPPEVIRTTIRNNQKCFVLRRLGAAESFETRPSGAAQDEAGKDSAGLSPHPEAAAQRPSKDEAGTLAPNFVLVANIEASDGGKEIVAGNERVIRARLADAEHFWKTDLAPLADYRDKAEKPLDQRLAKLRAQEIVFHEKLGTQGERIERIARLAREIAPLIGADPDKAERAANLAKADLVTEMVGEFPELQGLMGKYYALKQGEDPSVAAAIEDHYKPLGPTDRVPTDPVAIAVALADKLDMLSLFFWVGEVPTGSKDPYALRRAALGVIRIILDNGVRLHLSGTIYTTLWDVIHDWDNQYRSVLLVSDVVDEPDGKLDENEKPFRGRMFVHLRSPDSLEQFVLRDDYTSIAFVMGDEHGVDGFEYEGHFWDDAKIGFRDPFATMSDLLEFFADRLKVQLREQGARHDLVDAVFALGQGGASPFETRPAGAPQDEAERGSASTSPQREADKIGRKPDPHPEVRAERASKDEGAGSGISHVQMQDDLLLIVHRVEALGKFLDTEDGKNLLAGYKRAANILRDEEKKSDETYDGSVDGNLLTEPEEKALAAAIDIAIPAATKAVAAEDFEAAMTALAGLRPPVDEFFDTVMVNAPDEKIRANRLRLLNKIREATLAVADFSKVGG